jgi:hypothetical protein
VHNVDATSLVETLGEKMGEFDEVTFCHPHIGSENIQRNSSLVAHFFDSAKKMKPKVIQITLLDS